MASSSAVKERYYGAISAKSLVVDERTTMSDSDVLAAMGFAGRALEDGERWGRSKPGQSPKKESITPAPLATALGRLFAGDHHAAHVLVRIMAQEVYAHSRVMRVKIQHHAAFDMARACLAYGRDPTCKPCGGHGKTLVPETGVGGAGGVLSERDCPACKGTGRIRFESEFRAEHRELARWLLVQLEEQAGMAFAQAARSLARDMEL